MRISFSKLRASMAGQTRKDISRCSARHPASPPTVDLPLDAFIPGDYVSDVDTRLELYRNLGNVDAAEKLDDILKEYTDRFGTPPPEVQNLLYAVKIKGLAAKAGIESITTEEGQIIIRRFGGLPFDARTLAPVLRDEISVGRTQIRIHYKKIGKGWKHILEGVVRRIP